jgi:hypothetical protein
MPDRRLRKASKTWAEALENMRAALAENPMLAHPLTASAQAFEDVGRMIFGTGAQSKKKAAKRTRSTASARKSTAASAPKRKKVRGRAERRTRTGKKPDRPPQGKSSRIEPRESPPQLGKDSHDGEQ